MLTSSHGDNIGNAIGNSFASFFKFLFNKSTFAQLTTADRQRRFVLVMSVTILMSALVAVAYALGASQQVNTRLSTRPLQTKLTGQASPSPVDTSQAASSSQSSSDSADPSNATSVTVNGQSVDVPANGSFSKTVTSDDSTTTVNGKSSQSSSTSGGTVSNNSSTTVDVNSRSN